MQLITNFINSSAGEECLDLFNKVELNHEAFVFSEHSGVFHSLSQVAHGTWVDVRLLIKKNVLQVKAT